MTSASARSANFESGTASSNLLNIEPVMFYTNVTLSTDGGDGGGSKRCCLDYFDGCDLSMISKSPSRPSKKANSTDNKLLLFLVCGLNGTILNKSCYSIDINNQIDNGI